MFLSCANQLPPSGGPVDTVPPKIISTVPAPYTVRFSDRKIDLEFDKYVDHRSAEESIFISPYVGDLEFDWSGKGVEITFSEKLKADKTYVVNVGTDVVDLNNRNRMAQAFTLAFSTGNDIDHGAIRGRVYTIKPTDAPEGVMVFAYQLAGMDADTLNPRTLKPDYITQTGKNGDFFFQHLAFGAYRVVAVRDEFRNLLYDPEADDFGVPARPLVLTATDTMQSFVFMQLAKEDTTKPRLVKVDAPDVHRVSIEFSEPLDTTSRSPVGLSIVDTVSLQTLGIISVFPNLPSLTSYTVVTDAQDSTKTYRLTVSAAKDLVGLPISPVANSLLFAGAAVRDSLAPRLVESGIADSTRGVVLLPSIRLRFTSAILRDSLQGGITLRDSSGQSTPVETSWSNDAMLYVRPTHDLLSKCWYKLSVLLYHATDWSGKRFKDSVKVVRFETLDPEALSSIEGTVVDHSVVDTSGRIFVRADEVEARQSKTYVAAADREGRFVIGQLNEGRYVLRAFRDRNANGTYDAGKPFPFVESERFSILADTLKVRARWPLEGVRIDLR